MSDQQDRSEIARLAAEIVTSYVSHHSVGPGDLPRLIEAVGRELATVGQEPEKPQKPEPAVPVRRSVQRDFLVCLVCGRKLRSLRRHLQTAHGLTPQAYREMFDLRPDYPMVAPAASEQRAEIARRTGLGQRRRAEPAVQPAPEPQTKPRRGRGGRRAGSTTS